MPISRVLLFVLVGLIGLAGGQRHKPEEVVGGTIKLVRDVVVGVRQGIIDGLNPAPNTSSRSTSSRCCESSAFQASMCGCQVSLGDINRVISEIQAGLVERGCLSKLTSNGKTNVDGHWGPRTNEGYDKFAKDVLGGDRVAVEARLGLEFYDKLLQQIEDAKKIDRRCMKTNEAKNPGMIRIASSVEGRIAKIRTIDGNDIMISGFGIVVDGILARSLVGCWNSGRVKINISNIDIISFKKEGGIFSRNLISSNCSFRRFDTEIQFRDGKKEDIVLKREDFGPSILGNSKFGQWHADGSQIKQIKFVR